MLIANGMRYEVLKLRRIEGFCEYSRGRLLPLQTQGDDRSRLQISGAHTKHDDLGET
jgi:hypothetical protein